MKIKCSKCAKVFNIPDERLPMGQKIAFPCPVCKGLIELDLRKKDSENESPPIEKPQQERLIGDALKKKILHNVKDLPPMPQTVLKAREIIANPRSDFKDLADLFETDQAIAAKILKLANSPYYGFGGKVSSIQRASVILGHKTLGELISMGGASSILGKRLDGYGLDAGALWKHSLAVAFGSRIIAQKVDPSLLNDAFTSGLIHDTGKLILDKYIAERWDEFEAFMANGDETFLNAEKTILELDHADVAFEVCKTWNIPKTLTIAIRYHHVPSRSNGSVLAYVVHVADAIAMMTGLGLGIDGFLYKMDDGAMGFLGLKEETINDIMTEVLNAAKKISTI
jgi:HD-like signal output (HDOD) protein